MRKKILTPKNIINCIIWVAFALLAAFATSKRMGESLEYLAEDRLYKSSYSIPSDLKIIAIDEKSLDMLGAYSEWDRSYFAKLITILNEEEKNRPLVIGVDVIFSGTGKEEGDAALVQAAQLWDNLVLACELDVAGRKAVDEDGNYYYESYVASRTSAFEELFAVTENGFTRPIFDSDGYIRRAYGQVESGGEVYRSFALSVARKAGYEKEPESFEFAYSGRPGDYEILSMSDVLSGVIPASYFRGAIVLIGSYEEGMMDSFSVPVSRNQKMYGVEIQANEVTALLNNRLVKSVPTNLKVFLAVLIILVVGVLIRILAIKYAAVATLGASVVYLLVAKLVYAKAAYKLDVLYVPVLLVLSFLVQLFVRYIGMQKERALDMQRSLFSMADSMAEAIEGRTPYNANHTKNVAKRSVEMLDYINGLHKKKQTKLHFSKNDKNQMYLAAMLHDIGKMDVPTDIMDKPTKLGVHRKELESRLTEIMLRIRVAVLEKRLEEEKGNAELSRISSFLQQLDGFNCGRPLKEEELLFLEEFGKGSYQDEEVGEIPYLTDEEAADLLIKAGTLSEEERSRMQSHVVYTDKILSHMYFGKEYDRVRRMAADHHELLNGKGYPNKRGEQDLDVMTRILTIMDIYDSLIADDRPYKKAKPIPVAFDILEEEAQAGKVDKELLAIAKDLYGEKEETQEEGINDH